MRILLLVDDCDLADDLTAAGFKPETASDSADLDRRARSAAHDILIVDLELLKDGFSLLKAWQRCGITAHVLVLTSCTAETILALNSGADAAQAAPCEVAELLARVRVLARRRLPAQPWVLRRGGLEINGVTRSVQRGGRIIRLSDQQFRVLWCLASRPGSVVTYPELSSRLGAQAKSNPNHIAVVVRYLRIKIDKAFKVQLISTVWKTGYMMPHEACSVEPLRAAAPTTPAQPLPAPASERDRVMEYHPSAP